MFDSIKSFFGNKKSLELQGAAPFYPSSNSARELRELTRSDYLRLYQSWVYLATSTIADSVANLQWKLERNGKEIDHPYLKLINPNLLRYISAQMLITGTAYIWKRQIGNKIDSFDYLRSDTMYIEENPDGSLKNFRYSGGRSQITIQPSEVMDFSLFNPMLTYPYTVKGVSPVAAVAIQAEMDRVAKRWNWNFFRNGARPGDILQTEAEMSRENKELIVRKWKDQYGGVENAHKVAVLDNGLKYVSVGVNKKDMDFVEGQRFTRDEILSIFKLPPAIVGIVENSNRANATVALETYFRVCIEPLASQIADVITKNLFYGIGTFRFVNVVPVDAEQLTKDLALGAISINEYRQARGYAAIAGYDSLEAGETSEETPPAKDYFRESIYSSIAKHVKGTKEYLEARDEEWKKKWEKQIKRLETNEKKFEKTVQAIFTAQEKDVLKALSQKKTKIVDWDKPSKISWAAMWTSTVGIYRSVFQEEWNAALEEVWVSGVFQVGNPKMNAHIKDFVGRLAKSANDTTVQEIEDIVKQGNDEGIGSDEMARRITKKFTDFRRDRAKMIARTETTTAANTATVEAWNDSEVVEGKEWWTSIDERRCPQCGKMHGKKIELNEKFFKKGDTFDGMKLNYSDVIWPSLHPSCRCSLLPILK